jgi:hypothetical protein
MNWNYDMHKAYAAEQEARAQRAQRLERREDDVVRVQTVRRNQLRENNAR